MTFRNNLYLDDIILKFSIDSLPIPYIIKDNKIQLIDGKKLNYANGEKEIIQINGTLPNETLKFNRRRRIIENTFMTDYLQLSNFKTINSIDNYKPKITGNHLTILINELKNYFKNQLLQPQIKEVKAKTLLRSSSPTSPRNLNINTLNFTYDNSFNYPYRTYEKLKPLYDEIDKSNIKTYNNFDIKKSKNNYSLKTYSNVKNSFIGDIFFESNISAFLLLININTRYAYAYQLGKINTTEIINVDENNKEYEMSYATKGRKTTDEIIKAFNRFIDDKRRENNKLRHTNIKPVNILRFDGERAIGSKRFIEYLNNNNIKFIPSIPGIHTSLSLIDRLSRTIRDIAFNLNIEGIYTQEIMNKIINYYNNTRHETLTKILFKAYPELKEDYLNGISPKDVNENNKLETLYVKECIKYNLFVSSQNNYELDKNETVKVYNNMNKMSTLPLAKSKKRTTLLKDDYKVVDKVGNIYKLKNVSTNRVLFKPRFEIKK